MAGVAQTAERLTRNEQVRGSIPLPGSAKRPVGHPPAVYRLPPAGSGTLIHAFRRHTSCPPTNSGRCSQWMKCFFPSYMLPDLTDRDVPLMLEAGDQARTLSRPHHPNPNGVAILAYFLPVPFLSDRVEKLARTVG